MLPVYRYHIKACSSEILCECILPQPKYEFLKFCQKIMLKAFRSESLTGICVPADISSSFCHAQILPHAYPTVMMCSEVISAYSHTSDDRDTCGTVALFRKKTNCKVMGES